MAKNPNSENINTDEDILDSFERGEWRSVTKLQSEVRRYQEYASSWLEVNRLVSLTLPAHDFERLKQKAGEAGISYQALVANLVRQFVTGQIHTAL